MYKLKTIKTALVFCLLLILCLHLQNAFSQVNEEWFRSYGLGYGPNIMNDLATDLSGNSYMVGYIALDDSESRKVFGTIKYNTNGELQWANLVEGSEKSFSYARAVVSDNLGNVYVTGDTDDIDSLENFCTVKLNSNGAIEWKKKYQAFPGSRDYAADICMDNEGFIYVTGANKNTNSGIYYFSTVKYDPAGNLIWAANFDENINTNKNGCSITVDNSNNVYVSGYMLEKFCTIKYNSTGIQQWVSYFDIPDVIDFPSAIMTDNIGNVYVLGKNILNIYDDYYTTLVKFDNSGKELWAFTTDSISKGNGFYTYKMSFRIDQDGNVYFATGYRSNCSLIKLNPDGNLLWNAKYNESDIYLGSIGNAVEIDKEGFIYVNGTATRSFTNYPDFITLKYDSNGILKWTRNFTSYTPSQNESAFIEIDNIGNVYVAGMTYGPDRLLEFCVVKYSQSVGITNISTEIPSAFNLYQNYPNPFNPVTKIQYETPVSGFVELIVFDVLGKEIMTLVNENQNAGKYETEFSGADLPGGLYFYKLTSGSYNQTKKLLLLK